MKVVVTLLMVVVFTFLAFKKAPVYTKKELTGEIDPEVHEDFVLASSQWSTQRTFLRKEVYNSFLKMAESAKSEGINLVIVSGTRNHQRQSEIWEEKWKNFGGDAVEKANEILKYSSMPGTSRHHWGTDFDLNSVEVAYFETPEGTKVYEWLSNNAWKFRFFQPYNKKGLDRESGYKEEKWHWSYFPLSYRFLKAYNKIISKEDIKGFNGSDLVQELNVFNDYVNGIHSPRKTDSFKN